MSESEVCKLESVPLDFGDYHPLKPITVSFFVLLENESEFKLVVFLFLQPLKLKGFEVGGGTCEVAFCVSGLF